ncbi:putative copine [Helianthus annuus]|uniref:Copine n=1 Tax=Helianthus annuus TaxID=4232 RepID=A0A251UAT0_HELAN|nr:putative copine [Helianthus annuus]KAJ0550032.1 putative copine [Helianthus annuus]KAJ0562990.1 putative copine [Helianthus annuus]KAJ0728359.1 putative copine [Helianthus annuus]KAJ0731118.1 putative copine [Helianthus annuus]
MQVTEALARAGLESSNLILGIDFTKSNEWTGSRSFHRKSLHHTGDDLNPYEMVISIIGKTLAAFDEDNLIPCYGFGDGMVLYGSNFFFIIILTYIRVRKNLFNFYLIAASTHDQDVFSFYPEERCYNGFEEVLSTGSFYYLEFFYSFFQLKWNALFDSKLPLSIVLAGVGDGPWDTMKEFDDNIPSRSFDNF